MRPSWDPRQRSHQLSVETRSRDFILPREPGLITIDCFSEETLPLQDENKGRPMAREMSSPESSSSGSRSKASELLSNRPVSSSFQTSSSSPSPSYRVYKRRWFGLIQLVLLNIVVSWDWLTFSSVSTTASQYFEVSENTINWLSTAFLLAFVVISPVTLWTLNKGPKPSILASSSLILAGSWVRYGGAKAGSFPVVMVGQVIIGFAQPFVLAAPTRYSDLWFTEKGRVSATAVASLANPLGGALGQLISPFWASEPSQIPDAVLYTAIISSIAAIPSFCIPDAPPTPPSASSSLPKFPLSKSVTALSTNLSFYFILIPFSVYVGFFNALSSLLNQALFPYGFSETQAGIGGGLLILVGLVAAAIISPIIDRTHAYVLLIKILVPIIAASYLAFIFAPPTKTVVAPFLILSILGASSFALVPVSLEYLVELTFPISPEVSSVICWTGGQLLGAVFIIAMSALKDDTGTPDGDNLPPGNLQRGLIFEGIISCFIVIPPMLLGIRKLGLGGESRRRFAVDEGQELAQTEVS